MAKTTWALMVERLGDEDRLKQYAKGDTSSAHPNFSAALDVADGMMRSKLTLVYTGASYDAWNEATIPSYVRFHLESMVLASLTASDDARPEMVGVYAKIAADWLDDVVAGKVVVADLLPIDTSSSSSFGGTTARVGISKATSNIFDRDNRDSFFRTRNPRF